MRAVIISGGAVTDYDFVKEQIRADDTVICADSGYDHAARMGIVPSVVVGDFDSVKKMPSDVACIRYPCKKDLTDTEIALEYARSEGFGEFVFLGATGSRMDHSLANILLLKSILERGEKGVLIDEHNKVMLTDSYLQLQEPAGSVVSLIPLSDCVGITTENLEYPLCGSQMKMGRALGISNVMLADNAIVSVCEGLLLVIVAKD